MTPLVRVPSGPGGMRYPAPEIGSTFKSLTVASEAWIRPGKGQWLWTVCVCGRTTTKRVAHLLRGIVTSCGCVRPPQIKPWPERFWSKVDRRGPDECWPWTAAKNRGYGVIGAGPRSSGRKFATRVSWELEHGAPPRSDMDILHRCDNPPCVNPAHLFEGTAADNVADMLGKGRESRGRRHGDAVRAGKARERSTR